MKALAIGALGTIVAQGLLGGLTVLRFLPPAISTAHATVAQTFFCIAVAIAAGHRAGQVDHRPAQVVSASAAPTRCIAVLSVTGQLAPEFDSILSLYIRPPPAA